MRKVMFVVCAVLLFAATAGAQGKLISTWNCPKGAAPHSLDVGDEPNHAYAINQANCTASKGQIEGVKDKTGVGTEFHDVMGNSNHWHGVFVVTMANGDKVHYDYQGSGTTKDGNFVSGTNKWTISGGTGKFKGLKGSGTCAGKGAADGSATWECTGTYTAAK